MSGEKTKVCIRRCRRNVASVGTFLVGNRSQSGKKGLRGVSAYNEIEKVVAKWLFPLHLPVNRNQEYRRECYRKGAKLRAWRKCSQKGPKSTFGK